MDDIIEKLDRNIKFLPCFKNLKFTMKQKCFYNSMMRYIECSIDKYKFAVFYLNFHNKNINDILRSIYRIDDMNNKYVISYQDNFFYYKSDSEIIYSNNYVYHLKLTY